MVAFVAFDFEFERVFLRIFPKIQRDAAVVCLQAFPSIWPMQQLVSLIFVWIHDFAVDTSPMNAPNSKTFFSIEYTVLETLNAIFDTSSTIVGFVFQIFPLEDENVVAQLIVADFSAQWRDYYSSLQ